MKAARPVCAIWLATVALCGPAGPVQAETVLADPAQEARAQALGREIRCVVCENEPVALSQAEIAIDMREAIRTRIAAGDTDAEVRSWFASRYGDFVLLRPKVSLETAALWGAPLILLLAGAGGIVWQMRRSGRQAEAAVSPADDAEARAAILRHQQPD
ncbi:MAG: cytochrome c-type biogenesis protein CcmH [Hyphomonadaceae bacterium]|jgi:cytochrome c-type biogenesis protein CcmH|nr:cytochrome c-type biogenesis protein CcmH [Hyphomonadaceae bacterium]